MRWLGYSAMAKNRTLLDFMKRDTTKKSDSKERPSTPLKQAQPSQLVAGIAQRVSAQHVQQPKEKPVEMTRESKEAKEVKPESVKSSSYEPLKVSTEQEAVIAAKKDRTLSSTAAIAKSELEETKKLVLGDLRIIVKEEILSNIKVIKPIRDREEVGAIERGFLLDVEYDGERNKAVLIIYDPNKNKLVYWYDRTGHKPYFLTDLPPDKISRMSEIVKHPSFEGLEVVERIDLLYGVKRTLTKIVTKDPLAVRYLRNKVPIAWEADIRYHINYIYDNQLIPGIEYTIIGAEIHEATGLDIEELKKHAMEVLDETERDDETVNLAANLMKLFEARWFSPKRIAIDIEVYTPFAGRIPSPEYAEYPVMSIAMVSNDGVKRVLVLFRENLKLVIPDNIPSDADIEIFDSEYAMLLEFFSVISSYPIVLSFNGDNFDFRYIYRRAQKLGIPREVIPIKIKRIVKGNKQEYQAKIATALHVDLYKFFSNRAIQAYAFEGRYKEFTLDAISQALLGIGKVELDEEISKLDLATLVKYNLRDAELTLQLTTFNDELVWKLILLLMRVSKMGLEDVTRTTVSVWIKNLFYWEHRRRGALIPRKEDILRLKGKKVTEAIIKGKKYAGAIVIDPPQGVFFNVTVLDYASLYPSIIKSWNLSYETIDPPEGMCKKIKEIVDEKGNVIHTVCIDRPGITAQIVGLLRDFRVRIYKKKAKDKSLPEEQRNWYDVVQRAMKVYINASYGVFGAETFPLYAPSVAESVTALGRRVITSSLQKARELGLIVLYGDTDSMFVWNPNPEALEKLKEWVHKEFNLELEVDKTYRFVAFALKKNYLGVLPDGTIDIKGMVGKKRNTPDFIKKLFMEIVKEISSIEDPEQAYKVVDRIRERMFQAYLKLKYRILTLDEAAFKTGLTKPLSEYKRAAQPHVKAAIQLLHHGIQVQPGDIIAYVKVKTKDGVKPIQLAKITEIDPQKYIEAMKTALEQLLTPFNISWEEVAGGHKLLEFAR